MNKSMAYYLARFAILYIGVILAIYWLINRAYKYVPDLAQNILENGGGTGLGAAALLVPVMFTARAFWVNEDRRETRGEGWGIAFGATMIAVAVSAALIALVAYVFPTHATIAQLSAVWAEMPDTLLMALGVAFVVYLLVFRMLFWAGLRGEDKKAERRARRAA